METIPEEVRRLLRQHVASFEQLQVLLLLGRSSDAQWIGPTIAAELGISPDASQLAADELAASGLLERVEALPHDYYRSVVPLPLSQALQKAYEDNRLELINLMSANAFDRLRTSALRTFTRAFRLRANDDG
jgi:hypothetical protein